MMKIIDTHAHLYDKAFSSELNKIITQSKAAHITAIYMPNINLNSIQPMLEVAQTHSLCKPMLGLHPCYVDNAFKSTLNIMAKWLPQYPFTAIGEIGIDLYQQKTNLNQQIEALQIQLQWAIDYQLPVVLHCRNSLDQVIAIIKKTKNKYPTLKGIFHCFTGTLTQAQQAIDMGFGLGIGGIVTFKNNPLTTLLPSIGLDHMVVETDSPYLAPIPYRGKRNEPTYLIHILQALATIKNVSVEEVAHTSTLNAEAILKTS